MLIGFVDESGTPSPASGEQFFTVALLLVQKPRLVETLVRRVRRSLHRHARISELKAARSHPGVIRRLMAGLAAIECEVYVIAVDKQSVAPQQSEAVYRAAMARLVRHCVERHPQVNVYLDRRYTNRAQQSQLERTIREAIAHVPGQVVLIKQLDSWAVPGLQAVDFVAWAFEQKYALGNDWAAQVIAGQVIMEEIVQGSKIAARPGDR